MTIEYPVTASLKGGIGRVAGVITFEDEYRAQLQSQFEAQLLSILGTGVLRLWVPNGDDTTVSVDKTKNQVSLTHNATVVGRIQRKGFGWYVSFDGSTNYATFPDAADLSFGDGSLDGPFHVVMAFKATNTANNRTLFGKYTTNQREYRAYLATNDTLQFSTYDESTDAAENLASNAAIPQDTWITLILTYDGSEDSDGMIAYVNGLAIATTATSDVAGTYTAMEAGTSVLGIGSGTGAASIPFEGDYGLFEIGSGVLTPEAVWQAHKLIAGYLDFLG